MAVKPTVDPATIEHVLAVRNTFAQFEFPKVGGAVSLDALTLAYFQHRQTLALTELAKHAGTLVNQGARGLLYRS